MLLRSMGESLNQLKRAHPNDRAPTNAPRSAGVAMSAITPYATEKVPDSQKQYIYPASRDFSPEIPALWSILSRRSATKDLESAIPTFAQKYKESVTI